MLFEERTPKAFSWIRFRRERNPGNQEDHSGHLRTGRWGSLFTEMEKISKATYFRKKMWTYYLEMSALRPGGDVG